MSADQEGLAELTTLVEAIIPLVEKAERADRHVPLLELTADQWRTVLAALRSPGLDRDGERMRPLPTIEFRQQDWIPGFAAFLPGATTPAPESKAFCVLNLGALLGIVATGAMPASDVPAVIADSIMHEVIHVIEQWAGTEFSEDRVEGLIEKYRSLPLAHEEKAGC